MDDEVLYLKFGNIFSFFKHFIQGVVVAEFQDDVDILRVFKNVIEGDNIFVGKGFVDFDLSDELRMGKGVLFVWLWLF